MNGVRTTFMRRGYLLTALSALLLLAASAGTASAQGTISGLSVSLDSPTVNEGGTATATAKFTLTAGDDTTDVGTGAAQIPVNFGFNVTGEPVADLRGGVAADLSFIGLATSLAANTQFVQVSALRPGGSRTYTVSHTFGLNHDLDAEDARFRLSVSVPASTNTTVGQSTVEIAAAAATLNDTRTYTIKDDETQSYVLSIPAANNNAIKEDATARTDVTLTAIPSRTAAGTVPNFTVTGGPQGFFSATPTSGSEVDIDADATKGEWTDDADGVNAGAPARHVIGSIGLAGLLDRNREDDTHTLQLYVGGVGSSQVVHELPILVVDDDKLPAAAAITAEAADEDGKKVTQVVEGGDPVFLTIAVDRGADAPTNNTTTEALSINIRADSPGSYKIEPSQVTLDDVATRAGKQMTDVDIKLTALNDENVNDEELELHLVVSGLPGAPAGSSTGTFTIAVVDETAEKVWTKDGAYDAIKAAEMDEAGEDGLNPGESFTVKTSDLFELADGYTASYGVAVEGGAVRASASGDEVRVNAEEAGEAKVTVTAKAKMASSSFMVDQTESDYVEVTFPVTVVDTALKVTVAADPAEIDEGGTSEITATANRAVVVGDGEVVVDLEVLVGEVELDADSIMIAEGEMSGSVMLTAGEDDDYEDEAVTVLASGSGIDGNMQVNIAVADTDMAPDALVVTLHAPEDVMEGNIVEGMSYDIMVTANRAVTDDEGEVEVMIMRDRSKSDAGDDDFEVTSATIMAGEDSATATLMVTEDDMPDAGHAMGEVLVLYGESDHAEVEGELMFTIWDEMVPALPLIAQLLLALFLMAGGTRLYRRRQS